MTSSAQTPTVLRSASRLVQVNVIALDKSGHPVADLTANDFTVLDEGQEQTISIFAVEKSEATTVAKETLPPGTVSNRWEDRPGAPTSVTAVLLDSVNTSLEDQAYARAQVGEFLKQVRPQDRVGLFALGKNLRTLHDFSGDSASLLRALASYGGAIPLNLEPPPPDNGQNLSVDESMGGGSILERSPRAPNSQQGSAQSEYELSVRRRAQVTVAALQAIASYLTRLPGRKNLIWISAGFPFSIGYDALPARNFGARYQFSLTGEIERAARALNDANLAIYPVDARGLMAPEVFSATRRVITRNPRGAGEGQSEIDTMKEVAERTGGRAFYNTNGIGLAIRQALDDAEVTYVVAYYPTNTQWDRKFHRIKLRVARPGVQLHYRLGYFALPDAKPTDEEQKVVLEAAVWSPLDATAIGLKARLWREGGAVASARKLELQIDPRHITLEPQNDVWVGIIDLLLVQLSADGHNVQRFSQKGEFHLKRSTYENIWRNGLRLTYKIDLQSGATHIRVVVRDSTSAAMGSVTVPLE